MEKKTSPLATIIGGIVALIIGIFIIENARRSHFFYYSGYESGSTLGIVIILAALVTIAVGGYRMRNESEDDGLGTVEDFSERLKQEEKPAPAPAPTPVVVKVEKPAEKKFVFCPYCSTAQKEDYTTCESCGAGRKK